MTVKKLCYLVALTTVLFVQEELLTFLPNIQLTFVLVLVYGAVVGIKHGSLVVVAHVLLDNLFMGSFNYFTIIPMLFGLELTLIIGYLTRNKNEFIIALFGSISSFIYSIFFLISNVIFLDVKPLDYFIADIPFEIILVVCTAITVIFLYKPLAKICKNGSDMLLKKEE